MNVSPRRIALELTAISLVAALVGCSLEIPDGPQMQPLVESYEDPQGTLSEESLVDTVEEAQSRLERVEALSDYRFVLETLRDVAGAVNEAVSGGVDTGLRIKGVVNVTTACPGFGDTAEDDPENGSLEFKVTLERSKILDTVWGTFKKCRFSREGQELEMDSSLALYLGQDVPLTTLALGVVLFRLEGTFSLNGEERDLGWDFRVDTESDALEFRLPVSDGDVTFRFDPDLSRAAVRTRTGAFCCHFAERYCDVLAEDDCSGSTQGDQRLKW